MTEHPPMLFVYDETRGEYVPSEGRCLAKWLQTGPGHKAKQICGQKGTRLVAGMQVCDLHYKRFLKWIELNTGRKVVTAKEVERELHKERMRLDRERSAQQRKLDAERIRAEEAAREAERMKYSVVYYVQRPDGMIKIGTSRAPGVRLESIGRKHGALLVMALHSGAHAEESAVHRRFNALHIGGEWFRPELPLLEHINDVRKRMSNVVPEDDDLPPRMNRPEFSRLVRQAKEAAAANPAA